MNPVIGRYVATTITPTPGKKSATRKRIAWRGLLRALHRDFGYAAVGLTFVYALSGLAVNHIGDWDPSFENYTATHELGPLGSADDDAIAALAASRLAIKGKPSDVYRTSPTELDVTFDHRTLHVNPETGHIDEEGQKPRFFLRAANWLHLNRGKRAWRYVADTYAAALLFLAAGGMFMIAGRKGLFGRGAVLVILGAAVPTLYVLLSGGP
jgi:uncharacterized protein